MYDAEVNHCLSFEQVCDEVVEEYKIKEGKFDTISVSALSKGGFSMHTNPVIMIARC